ncbi:pseudouridylate synthase 7-like isoform X2 [Leptotrombidium deliense]|uniref:Pseudouridylate synthase 7-like isoform X2 n=1 Tax=Leptotrombidium deliense TaxID=299467 RepID=A0A443SM12_9ACAR|nr:pseudouridylate synthase 7-like isoform X2 [Leptotrombidium deliense]
MTENCKRIKLDENIQKELPNNTNETFDESDTYSQFKVPESDCGITHFVGSHAGFSGVLKQRYSDFVVHEIMNSGEIVTLNDFSIPVQETQQPLSKSPDSVLTEEVWAKIERLAANESEEVLIDVSKADKEERTAVHKKIAAVFSSLDTSTIDENDKKLIKVSLKGKNSRDKGRWPNGLPPYVHFTLYQENRGTFDALNLLARLCHTSAKNFQTAGCKDRRAISSQRVSVKKILPTSLLKVNEIAKKYPQPIAVGNFNYDNEKIRLGDLKGNRFDIVIKDVKYAHETDIDESVTSLKLKGFINYFGTQRFGFKHVPSSQIGLAFLQKDWEKVINLILSERPKDIQNYKDRANLPTFNECIRLWKETQDANAVFKQFCWKHSNEGVILQALSKLGKQKQSNNYYAALCALPRNVRTMYLHAYQSLIWNKLANFRLEEYGMNVVPGDILMFTEIKEENEEDEEEATVHPVIADENNLKNATIFDVVLPIVGSSIVLPENRVKDKLLQLLAEDGITIETFKSMAKQNMLYGTYRKFVQIPLDVSWSVHSYEDEKEQFITTDLQLTKNIVCQLSNTGSKKAVKLGLSLPSSTYATVVIRELFKRDLIAKIS